MSKKKVYIEVEESVTVFPDVDVIEAMSQLSRSELLLIHSEAGRLLNSNDRSSLADDYASRLSNKLCEKYSLKQIIEIAESHGIKL